MIKKRSTKECTERINYFCKNSKEPIIEKTVVYLKSFMKNMRNLILLIKLTEDTYRKNYSVLKQH